MPREIKRRLCKSRELVSYLGQIREYVHSIGNIWPSFVEWKKLRNKSHPSYPPPNLRTSFMDDPFHISNIRLNANFCRREKEGHFHSNFLRALKWVPTWHTYTIATKYFSLIGSQNIVVNQRAGIVWLSCRYIMWVLIFKLSKRFYNESDLLFHVHKSWLSTS